MTEADRGLKSESLDNIRENRFEVKWTKWSDYQTRSGKPTIELSSDLKLDNIPQDTRPCLGCGGELQREIYPRELEGDRIDVEAYGMPGHGCTSCGAKYGDPDTCDGFERSAVELFRDAGDIRMVRILEDSIKWSERNRGLGV